jgi:hypothetical protein
MVRNDQQLWNNGFDLTAIAGTNSAFGRVPPRVAIATRPLDLEHFIHSASRLAGIAAIAGAMGTVLLAIAV